MWLLCDDMSFMKKMHLVTSGNETYFDVFYRYKTYLFPNVHIYIYIYIYIYLYIYNEETIYGDIILIA